MITGLLFISLVLHLIVIACAFVVHNDLKVRSKAEQIVLGCVMFSAGAVLLGLFK